MPTLDWLGKKAVVNHHKDVPYRLVHCDSDFSAGDEEAGNLLVQGDNLEALKALLPYYAGKVKLIYIDPPYNTGNEGWVYNDNVNSPYIQKWLGETVGKEAEDLSRHDKWLCMMYPRLRLLKEFLTEDGAIFVSIDDNEVHHLRMMMDEIFGGDNIIANVVWQKKYTIANDAKWLSDNHDHIIIYAKRKAIWRPKRLPRSEEMDRRYRNPDNHPKGSWKSTPLYAKRQGSETEKKFQFTFKNGVVWTTPLGTSPRFPSRKLKLMDENDEIWFGEDGTATPSRKTFLSELKIVGTPAPTVWLHSDAGNNHQAREEIKTILPEDTFATPKPIKLLKRILQIATDKDSIILDSFAGSGTTGHAVLDLNKQDGGNRKFILVEMEKKIAKTVTSERLKRVINGYDKKKGDKTEAVSGLGGGFRFCTLGTPLFNEFGGIAPSVTFDDLAAHIFFSETGSPLPALLPDKTMPQKPLIGTFEGRALYLLFVPQPREDAFENEGNVFFLDIMNSLPLPHEGFSGQKVVYASACAIDLDRLKRHNITFKQIPYNIEGGF